MIDPDVADSNFNMTWVFPVDPEFSYLVRVHFCDIYSKSPNTLVFTLYINSDVAFPSLDLSTLVGNLNTPYYKDFITNSSANSDTLTVSVGPDTSADLAAAILNGLEIMKISNEAKSLDGHDAVANLLVSSSKKKKIGIIVGCAAGASAALLLIGLCYCCLVIRKSKTPSHGNSWLPLPLYGNSLTLTKGSTVSQKSGTASCISLASSNLGRFFTFQEIMEATNKFDESSLLGVGGFGRVYQGTLEDGTKVAVKRGNPRSIKNNSTFKVYNIKKNLKRNHHNHI